MVGVVLCREPIINGDDKANCQRLTTMYLEEQLVGFRIELFSNTEFAELRTCY